MSEASSPRPTITVVGLGPGGPEHVTAETLRVIAEHEHRFLRTQRHPSAHLVASATSFDDVYDSAATFDDVYATITDQLVDAAHRLQRIVYAVPGSPMVLEQTVARLRVDTSVDVRILPAMSFLDVAYAVLGVDPIEAGLKLIDGHDFAVAAAGYDGPMLIAHTHANWVLSDIKLSLDADGDEPVVILNALGTDQQQVVHTTWAELDRAVEADHLTSVYVPRRRAAVAAELVRFHQLARTLREQCPWDQQQTHETLVQYLLEETYEVVDALQALDPDDPSTDDALVEELGDLLYQIEFHAVIAEQQGRFSMADIAQGVHDKLVRRHPHVFGSVSVADADEVVSNWNDIKRAEKQRTSVFDGVASAQPSLSYAFHVQRKASKVGFDWPNVEGALPKVAEETNEVIAAAAAGDTAAIADEVGDLLFAVVNVARHLGVEPEAALRAATHKFRARFEHVERLAAERGIDVHAADLSTLDALWEVAKGG